jgi:hypothetical protein
MPLEATPIETVKLPEPLPTTENMAAMRALATPLPGPVAAAFFPGGISVAGYSVRKLVAFDHVFWQFTKSPILEMLLELAKPEQARETVKSTDEQEWEIALQFTTSPRDLRELMKSGREAVAEAAFEKFGAGESKETVSLILLACFEQIRKNFETSNQYAADAKEGGQISFFRESPPPA